MYIFEYLLAKIARIALRNFRTSRAPHLPEFYFVEGLRAIARK
jgi:hypothetical protein